jgi:Putative capsular polysaccharide synthesis protein
VVFLWALMVSLMLGKLKLLSHYRKLFANESNILVYQMGKVGSTAFEGALDGSSIHLHTLYSNNPCPPHVAMARPNLIARLMGLVSSLVKRQAVLSRSKIKVISLVRDPYERNVSMFFQSLPFWYADYVVSNGIDARSEGYQLLFDAFEKGFDHHYPLTWFDREFKRLFGIDVFDYQFDSEKGGLRIQEGKVDLLILRMDKLSSCAELVGEFCGEGIDLQSANKGESKWYAGVYRYFRDNYVPSAEMLDYLYQSKFSEKFFTESEIINMRKKHLQSVTVKDAP